MSDQRSGGAPAAGAEDPALGSTNKASQRGISNGTNSRPLDDTIAQSGPGIPDDTAQLVEFEPGEEEKLDDAIRHLPGSKGA